MARPARRRLGDAVAGRWPPAANGGAGGPVAGKALEVVAGIVFVSSTMKWGIRNQNKSSCCTIFNDSGIISPSLHIL